MNLIDRPAPQVTRVHQDVVLVDEGQMLTFPGLSADECIANDTLHAVPGVDADLGGDLCR
jgi:hypothetical protein